MTFSWYNLRCGAGVEIAVGALVMTGMVEGRIEVASVRGRVVISLRDIFAVFVVGLIFVCSFAGSYDRLGRQSELVSRCFESFRYFVMGLIC